MFSAISRASPRLGTRRDRGRHTPRVLLSRLSSADFGIFTKDYTADFSPNRAPVEHEMGKADLAEYLRDTQGSQQMRAWRSSSDIVENSWSPPTPPFTQIMQGLRARQRKVTNKTYRARLNGVGFCSYRFAARTGDGLSKLLPLHLEMGPRCFNHLGLFVDAPLASEGCLD